MDLITPGLPWYNKFVIKNQHYGQFRQLDGEAYCEWLTNRRFHFKIEREGFIVPKKNSAFLKFFLVFEIDTFCNR